MLPHNRILGLPHGMLHDAASAIVDANGNIVAAESWERKCQFKHAGDLLRIYDKITQSNDRCYRPYDKFVPTVDDYVFLTGTHYIPSKYKYKKLELSPKHSVGHWDFSDSFAPEPEPCIRNQSNYYDYCSALPNVQGHVTHHPAHFFSAAATRPWDEADTDWVGLVIDGGGDQYSTMIIDSTNTIVYRSNIKNSLGHFYSMGVSIIGFKPELEDYTVMGLAAYGQPIYTTLLHEMFNTFSDNLNELNYARGKEPASIEEIRHRHANHLDKYFRSIKVKKEDVAASFQQWIEDKIVDIATIARRHGKKLVYAGGVAQNIRANSILKTMFDDVWIMPAAPDDGTALGAAAYGYWYLTGKTKLNWVDAYLGYSIDNDINPKQVAKHIIQYKICGVANGPSEYGPRALGNRSLLADVRYNIKNEVNEIKRRQYFRPFGASILAEYADQYFEGAMNEYMQYYCTALHDYTPVIHVDGTCRVQLVQPDCRSVLRQILEEYYNLTGVPMLLNTSLNIRGKPMIRDEIAALKFEKKYHVKVF